MSPKEIDAHIMQCPYFGGKDTINRKKVNGEYVHVGSCALEWHYRAICPGNACLCAEMLGMGKENRWH